jgi:hypothetical protein
MFWNSGDFVPLGGREDLGDKVSFTGASSMVAWSYKS